MTATRYVNDKNFSMIPLDCTYDQSGSVWVSERDYGELEAQVKQLAAANQQLRDENLKSTSALYDVVAENAALKNALEWLYEAVSMPDSGPVPDKYYSAVTNAAAVMYEVTATESFLASLRAEGVDTYADFLAGLGWHEQDISNVRNFAAQLRSQSEQVKGVQS